jgi:hypothetical protein
MPQTFACSCTMKLKASIGTRSPSTMSYEGHWAWGQASDAKMTLPSPGTDLTQPSRCLFRPNRWGCRAATASSVSACSRVARARSGENCSSLMRSHSSSPFASSEGY